MSSRRYERAIPWCTLLMILCACSDAPDDPEADGRASSDALVAPHVMTRPALPTANYEPPSTNAIYVAPSGNDTTGTGSATTPYRTLGRALQIVNAKPAGPTWTIVLRAGIYREGELTITRDNVTVQRFRTEAVSLLGSVPVTSFSGAGPYTATINMIDPTPLEQNCADSHLDVGGDPANEMAFSVVRDGIPLRRVATGTTPAAGQYAYDPATNQLKLADTPKEIEIASKLYALRSKATNVTLAGLDIENYATCTLDWNKSINGLTYYAGAVVLYKDVAATSSAVIENCTIANNAAGAIEMARGLGMRVSGSTIVNNGWTGILAGKTDGLVVAGNDISYNNVRRWANSVEAGMKITYVRDGAIVDNRFEHNAANGFWCDQGCGSTDLSKNWFVVARNLVRYNDKKGIFYEVSHHGVIASNVVHDNGQAGIAAFGSRAVQIWNNTAVDNNESTAGYLANVAILDDSRCYSGDTLPGGKLCVSSNGVVPLSAGNYDHCEPSSAGPLASTCNAESVQFKNNIVSGSASSRPLLVVKDTGGTNYGAALILSGDDYQAYWRSSTTAPNTVLEWQANGGATTAYATLTAFRTAVPGRESHSVERVGGTTHPFFVDYAKKNFLQVTSNPDVWGQGATIPLEVLKAIYWPQTSPAQPTARIGAVEWRDKPSAAPTCGLAAPIFHLRNPTTGDHLFTASSSERPAGYTDDRGVAFHAAIAAASGVTPVYRLYRPDAASHFWTTSTTEKASAMSTYGFTVDEGIGYYAAPATGTCLSPVYRLLQSGTGHHTYTISVAERDALVAAGWQNEGVRFYATP